MHLTRLAAVAAAAVLLGGALAGCEGDDGKDGAPGTDGQDGAPGIAGPAGTGEVLLDLNVIGRYSSGTFGESAAEIVAYDPSSERLFVVNSAAVTVDVLNLANPANPVLLDTIDASAEGGAANSVAVSNGVAAVAIEVTVGALPDMLTFTPDGKAVLVANEGEPNVGYTIDPEGSVSVIDVSGGFAAPTVATADFTAFNASIDELRASGVRIYGPGATVAQDLEPEYIAVAPDGLSARVALQEANALAVLDLSDISAPVITDVVPLGFKDHMIIGNELDPSDRDPQVRIRNWPVFGMYQPDAIAAYQFNGRTYYVTANEGNDRNDFIPGEETARVKDLALDPTAFPDAAALQADSALGRLTVTTFDGDSDGPESRSDNKGPEPEGVVLGTLAGRVFAFIGLERIGGIMVYDVTNPQSARFVQYVNPRDFSKDPESELALVGDLGPEGLAFISAEDSPSGVPLLVVGNEVSGTIAIYQIDVIEL